MKKYICFFRKAFNVLSLTHTYTAFQHLLSRIRVNMYQNGNISFLDSVIKNKNDQILLIDFLNDALELKDLNYIKQIEYKNIAFEEVNAKKAIIKIVAKNNLNELLIIEIYYFCKSKRSFDALKIFDYNSLFNDYVINPLDIFGIHEVIISNETILFNKSEYRTSINTNYNGNLKVTYIELSKFLNHNPSQFINKLEGWCYWIKDGINPLSEDSTYIFDLLFNDLPELSLAQRTWINVKEYFLTLPVIGSALCILFNYLQSLLNLFLVAD